MIDSRTDWWVIGNPENRRFTLFQEAIQQAGLGPARCLSYVSLLDEGSAALARIVPGSVVRIDSPGENFEVEKRLLELGGVAAARQLPDEYGRIWYPRAWFGGFCQLLDDVRNGLPHAIWFNHPDDIRTMFDKPCCKALLAPHTLPACPLFRSATEFREYARAQKRSRFFIKLNYSSSASGIVAYDYNRRRDEEVIHSTVEYVNSLQGATFFNSLKIRRYHDKASITVILDYLFAQGALVEPWVPKAEHEGSAYDLRVLAINGKRRHAIARLSHSPMTNLHLGNRRCAVDELELADASWQKIDVLVADTMRHFPRSLYAGLDVLLTRHSGAPVLLEANAFGDLLPNLLHDGQSTYLAEIIALCEREGIAHAA